MEEESKSQGRCGSPSDLALGPSHSSTARGFEPLRAEPNGFLVHHLSHSVTLSCCLPLPHISDAFALLCLRAQPPHAPLPCCYAPTMTNAETRDRTGDLQIFSLTLSQLSYRGAACATNYRHTKRTCPLTRVNWRTTPATQHQELRVFFTPLHRDLPAPRSYVGPVRSGSSGALLKYRQRRGRETVSSYG